MDKCMSLPVLTTWLYSLSDANFALATTETKSECPKGTEDEVKMSYFLTEATPSFTAWLMQHGLYLIEADGIEHIYYDPDQFENISIAAQAIMADYDDDFDRLRELGCFPPYRNADDSPAEGSPWKKWDLGGDDDVDYNGGYITIILDCLKMYEEAHK